jgi:hypothetical protein
MTCSYKGYMRDRSGSASRSLHSSSTVEELAVKQKMCKAGCPAVRCSRPQSTLGNLLWSRHSRKAQNLRLHTAMQHAGTMRQQQERPPGQQQEQPCHQHWEVLALRTLCSENRSRKANNREPSSGLRCRQSGVGAQHALQWGISVACETVPGISVACGEQLCSGLSRCDMHN